MHHPDIVYQTTEWQRLLAGEIRERDADFQKAEKQGERRLGAWPSFQQEIFARLYGRPEKLEKVNPALRWAEDAHKLAGELPEWERLQKRTAGDEFLSGLATIEVAASVLDGLPADLKQKGNPQELQNGIQALKAMNQSENFNADQMIQKLQQQMRRAMTEGQKLTDAMDPGAIRQAFRQGIEQANQAIDETEKMLQGFGWDNSAARHDRGASAADKASLAARLQKSPKLKQIALKAGRMRRIAAHKQRSKTRHCQDEIQDVETGGELSRLLPAELSRLSSPLLRMAFKRDLLEKKTLQYRLDGKEELGKGPIIMLLDESGSMAGDKEIWAKAIFLGLLEIAQRQKRTCAFVPFSSQPGSPIVFEPGKQIDPEMLIAAVESFRSGGTNWAAACQTAIEVIEAHKLPKADVILITDGFCTAPGAAWDAARRDREITCYGVAIAHSIHPEMMKTCDECIAIADLIEGSTQESAATDKLFSL